MTRLFPTPLTREMPRPATPLGDPRLRASGNFLFCGEEKFFIKGVSYGTFAPGARGESFPECGIVARDFAMMRAAGFNSLRTYDVPPRWLLDLAAEYGLRILVGLPWQQHIAIADHRAGRQHIVGSIVAGVKACARHPAVLAYCVGNEIPTQIVRWYGKRKTEKLIQGLCDAAKEVDPAGLVTYANYPPTEYLELPFLDLHCFNVYLHEERNFLTYLARLQMLVGSKPICLSEYGLDAQRHGNAAQAEFLEKQTLDSFRAGLSGAIAFAWTDEWYRGGETIRDWSFGITDADRRPKPAYRRFEQILPTLPFSPNGLSRVSVVVAAYNAGATLDDCLTSLSASDYPNFEVIVIDDGSTDRTAEIADAHARVDHRIKVEHVPNNGLSVARNLGLAAATGDIVAYTDSDCRVDPDWLHYIVLKLMNSDVVGVGGPNLVPPDDGVIARAVGYSPGNPAHIMLSDEIAEHIPGCNMAFWKWVLDDVGGFQPVYTRAGDDVDMCWRLQARGYRIGFAPAALVWHHRRNSLRAYVRQQAGYGHAESLLEREHPEKFNGLGQVRWAGRLYAGLPSLRFLQRSRIYQGVFGSAYFQSLYQPAESFFAYLTQTPEWYALLVFLFALSIFNPNLLALPLAGLGWQIALCAHAALSAPLEKNSYRLRALVFTMHLVQPLARSWGRLQGGLGPFRWTRAERPNAAVERTNRQASGIAVRDFEFACWGEANQDKDSFLRALMRGLFRSRCVLSANSGWENWDLLIEYGLSARAHLLVAVEYHGGPRVLLRSRVRLLPSRTAIGVMILLIAAGSYLYFQRFGVYPADVYLDWIGVGLPLSGFAWMIWQRMQLTARIDTALRGSADELKMTIVDPKTGRGE